MNPIAQIIFDVLASGRGINLPEVGSLSVERDAARFVSRTEVRPPHNKVVFSTGENPGFESVIDVMAAAGEGRKEAESRYADWLAKAKTNRKMIEISEVGVLKNDFFYPSAKLHDTLNPGSANTVRLAKNTGTGRTILIVVLGILIVCAIIFLVFALNRYMTARNNAKATAPTEQVYAAGDENAKSGKDAPEDVIAGELESYAADRDAASGAGSTDSAGSTSSAGLEGSADSSGSTVGADAAEQNGKDVVADDGDENVVADAAKKDCKVCSWFRNLFGKKDKAAAVAIATAGESAADTSGSPAGEAAVAKSGEPGNGGESTGKPRESGAQGVAPSKECPLYHVVVGVFANPANADKIIAEDPMNIGCRAYNKLPFKNMTMVAAFSSNSKPLADAKRREFARYDNKVWIYVEE